MEIYWARNYRRQCQFFWGQNDYATVATGTFVGGEMYHHLKDAESFFLFFGDLKSTGVASYAKQETSKAKQDEYNGTIFREILLI